jgi:hypothetical protein
VAEQARFEPAVTLRDSMAEFVSSLAHYSARKKNLC